MRFSLRLVAKVVLISLATGMSPLAEIAPRCFAGDAPVSSDPVFKALLTDGGTVSGRLVSLGPGAITLATADGTPRALPLNRLIKLTREVPIALNAPEPSQIVVLPDGDRICQVTVGAANETTLEVKSDALGKLAVPLDCLLGLILSSPTQTSDFDALWDRVTAEPRSTEVVWLMNGDRLARAAFSVWTITRSRSRSTASRSKSSDPESWRWVSTPGSSTILDPRPISWN